MLVVDYQTDYKVPVFSDKTDWQRALVLVLKNQDKIAAQMEKTKEKASKTLEKSRRVDDRKDKLRAEAKKLGL